MINEDFKTRFEKVIDLVRINLLTRKCLTYLSIHIRKDLIQLIKELEQMENINAYIKNNISSMFSSFIIKKNLLKYTVFLILYDEKMITSALKFYYYSFFSAQFKKFIPRCNNNLILLTWNKLPIRSAYYNKYSYADIIDNVVKNIEHKIQHETTNENKYKKFIQGVNTIRQSLRIFAKTYYSIKRKNM